MKAELKISDAQAPQFERVAQAMRDNAKSVDQAMQQRRGNRDQPQNAVERLEARSQFASLRAQGSQRFLDAFKPLYASLSDDQKKAADEMLARHGHEHGPERVRSQSDRTGCGRGPPKAGGWRGLRVPPHPIPLPQGEREQQTARGLARTFSLQETQAMLAAAVRRRAALSIDVDGGRLREIETAGGRPLKSFGGPASPGCFRRLGGP